jgi:hypothetical protein
LHRGPDLQQRFLVLRVRAAGTDAAP